MTFTGYDKWSVEHSQSSSHYHKQMASSCRVHPGGYLSLPLSRPWSYYSVTNPDCRCHTCWRANHASSTSQPIMGGDAQAANALSESQRCLLVGSSYSQKLRPLCCQQRGRYGWILLAPASWSAYKVSVRLLPSNWPLTEQAKANFKEYLLLFINIHFFTCSSIYVFQFLFKDMLLWSNLLGCFSRVSWWFALLLCRWEVKVVVGVVRLGRVLADIQLNRAKPPDSQCE